MAYLTNGLKDIEWVSEVSESHSVVSDSLGPHSLSMEFSKQECWNGLPFPSKGDFPDPGIKPRSPALQADSLLSELLGKSPKDIWNTLNHELLCVSLWPLMESRDSRVRLVGVDSGFAYYELCDLYQTIQWTYLNSLDLCFHVYKIQVITSTLKDDEKFK